MPRSWSTDTGDSGEWQMELLQTAAIPLRDDRPSNPDPSRVSPRTVPGNVVVRLGLWPHRMAGCWRSALAAALGRWAVKIGEIIPLLVRTSSSFRKGNGLSRCFCHHQSLAVEMVWRWRTMREVLASSGYACLLSPGRPDECCENCIE